MSETEKDFISNVQTQHISYTSNWHWQLQNHGLTARTKSSHLKGNH